MGIYHFMGLGRAVGAVTCAVDYIENALDIMAGEKVSREITELFHSSGGISHSERDQGKIEALVLFTSPEVIAGTLNAFPYDGCDRPGSVRQEIRRNLKKVWRRVDPDEGRKVFWCEVDIDNFQDCFEKILKVAYRFSPYGKQGKEIWCNLTGGTNAIGFALLSMARLTGMAAKHYLISQRQDYRKAIKVPRAITISPNKDDYFNIVPFWKTYFDTLGFYEILLEIEAIGRAVTTNDLFSRLRGKPRFSELTPDTLKRHYMLKLFGLGYTDYDLERDETTITETGLSFINDLRTLELSLELEDHLLQGEIDIVAESKTWPWFQVETIP